MRVNTGVPGLVVPLIAILLFLVASFGSAKLSAAQSGDNAVPTQVQDLVGTYVGTWSSFGIDETGRAVKRFAWADTMIAGDPVISGERAFVTTSDRMTFEGGVAPPMTIPGTEGFFLNEDGSLGDRFFEMYGQTYRMQKLGENSWAYTMPASPHELTWLGFPADVQGAHVLLKVVTHEGGIETHRVSRVSTLSWTDADAGEQCVQYTSLQGYHRKN
ncbi:hypothetical protein ACFL6M_05890 [Candidatus Eisenbacteria bacterium]|uniref:DUF1579 domain-containing protein n=1 Tax=Eiseniibacteriota bacterium TaxID=2212470 RepID=A0ABV6YLR3_UNCEI